MTKFEIVIHKPHTVVTRYGNNAGDINERIYDTLTNHGVNEELAMDCACWCELADYGESYNENDFDVYVTEA